jgi:hypothetical protein
MEEALGVGGEKDSGLAGDNKVLMYETTTQSEKLKMRIEDVTAYF